MAGSDTSLALLKALPAAAGVMGAAQAGDMVFGDDTSGNKAMDLLGMGVGAGAAAYGMGGGTNPNRWYHKSRLNACRQNTCTETSYYCQYDGR